MWAYVYRLCVGYALSRYVDTVDLAVLLGVAGERTLTSQKAKHDVLKINVELICRKGTFRVPFGSKESL